MAPSVFRHSFKSSGLKRRVYRLEKEKTNLNEKIAATGEKSAEAGKQTDTPPGTTAQ
jgi:23S rRNA G2445 N2-methylase RlmL